MADVSSTKRRPWYLLLSLIVASLFGAQSFFSGAGYVALYHDFDVSSVIHPDDDPGVRTELQTAVDHYQEILDQEKRIFFPLCIADLLLGAALFACATGALAGRSSARVALVQVIVVQSIFTILLFFLSARVRAAQFEWQFLRTVADLRARSPNELTPAVEATLRAAAAHVERLGLGLRTLVAALVVFALTRKRSLAFYDRALEA